MNLETIEKAIDEAERFLVKARAAEHEYINNAYAWNGTKETSACRRASMDLTRALADLRRTRHG